MIKIVSVALVLLASATTGAAFAEKGGQPLKGKAAFGGYQQDKPGLRRLLTAQDLPPISKSTPNFAEVVAMPARAQPGPPAPGGGPAGGSFSPARGAPAGCPSPPPPPGSKKPTQQGVFANGLYQPYG